MITSIDEPIILEIFSSRLLFACFRVWSAYGDPIHGVLQEHYDNLYYRVSLTSGLYWWLGFASWLCVVNFVSLTLCTRGRLGRLGHQPSATQHNHDEIAPYTMKTTTNRHHRHMEQVGVGRYDDIDVLMTKWGNTQMTDYSATSAENHKKVLSISMKNN